MSIQLILIWDYGEVLDRYILHCDMNNFYASVECMLDKSLRDKPVAVCGEVGDRHGIVLAKNYLAKAFDIKVGETTWQAKQKCKDLVIVSPPKFHEYEKYSRLAKQVYLRYTDRVEPYGMDECWLDISNNCKDFDDAKNIADEIRKAITFELGLTVSVGVSFNKVFAKLGSDMKKPDATTVITKDNFRIKVWPLPASDLLGVGRATKKVFDKYYINTIGDIAKENESRLEYLCGKNGVALKKFANGEDQSEVMLYDDLYEAKSIGHGITTTKDLEDNDEVWKLMLSLSKDIGTKLRKSNKRAKGISIYIRDSLLKIKQWQRVRTNSIQSGYEIAKTAYELFLEKYDWENPIRTVTIQVIKLVDENIYEQDNLFNNPQLTKKIEKIEKCNEILDKRFGTGTVINAVLLQEKLLPKVLPNTTMPTGIPKQK